jgi:tetratricopeptide (TPR) repeat protein
MSSISGVGSPTVFRRMPGLFTLLGLICVFVQVHWLLWYYFDIDVDAQKLLAETATGGAIGIIYGFLPALNKRFLRRKVRQLLGSPTTLSAVLMMVVAIAGVGTSLNRTKIKWPAGQADIQIDGQKVGSDSWAESASNATSILGFFFQRKMLRVGDFSQELNFRPMVPLVYDVPESAVFSSRPEYQNIATLLALSFYQLVENRFLTDAKAKFATEEGKKFVDLNAVYPVIELCFNGTDIARSGDKLVGALRQQRATSPWLPLLESCLHYARGEFDRAAANLDVIPAEMRSPLLDAAVFFRAINQLRGFILKSNRGENADPALLAKAIAGFQQADEIGKKLDDAYFKEIARGSANVFQGIAHVYEHDNDKAFEAFSLAAQSSYPEIQARALSDMGYVTLLRGNLGDAKGYFTRALEVDSKFPYARTNLGYALLAEGHYDEARELFVRLTKDDELRRDSLRDVILSELAIAHVGAERATAEKPDPDAYNTPLGELGIFNYVGTFPPLLRLAQIRIALADKIYMSHDYYGLEMFALAMYARANAEARTIKGNPEAATAATRAVQAFQTVSKTVDPRCFIFQTNEGFFKPVADLTRELKLVQK